MVAEPIFKERQLRAIVCHDTNMGGRDAGCEEGLNKLHTNGSFSVIDNSVSPCFFSRYREEWVGVDEGYFGGGFDEGSDPASASYGAETNGFLASRKSRRGEMMMAQSVDIGNGDASSSNFLASTFETAVVDEVVAKCHYVVAHTVLMLQIYD